mgnify:CR=1 FL=1
MKTIFKTLKVGDKLSETQYYSVVRTSGDKVQLKNILNQDIVVDKNYVEDCLTSGNQFEKTEKISKEEIFATLSQAIANPAAIDIKKIRAIHQQLKAEADGLSNIPADLELGVQTKEARNKERIKFQSGQSEYCLCA